MGAWRLHGGDALTGGGSADVQLPLGALGQTAVGHDGMNPKHCSAIQSSPQHLTASFQRPKTHKR